MFRGEFLLSALWVRETRVIEHDFLPRQDVLVHHNCLHIKFCPNNRRLISSKALGNLAMNSDVRGWYLGRILPVVCGVIGLWRTPFLRFFVFLTPSEDLGLDFGFLFSAGFYVKGNKVLEWVSDSRVFYINKRMGHNQPTHTHPRSKHQTLTY